MKNAIDVTPGARTAGAHKMRMTSARVVLVKWGLWEFALIDGEVPGRRKVE